MSVNFSDIHREHHVKVEIADAIALVTLDRPESRNAVNAAMHRGLEIVFHELSHHPDVRVIVLTGAGESFCAGGDMKNYGGSSSPIDTLRNRDLNWSMARCEAPTLSAVNGAARGIGATIALLCDICYMADTASIGDVHTQFGLPAGDGGQVIWPLLVGLHRAKEYLMTGEPVAAEKAADMGLINGCIADAELDAHVQMMAERLRDLPPHAVNYTKAALNVAMRQMTGAAFEMSLGYEIYTMGTNDFREATMAFVEKRKGRFKGN